MVVEERHTSMLTLFYDSAYWVGKQGRMYTGTTSALTYKEDRMAGKAAVLGASRAVELSFIDFPTRYCT